MNDDRERRALILCGAVLALVTLGVYAPVGGFDFVNFDDYDYVLANPHVNTGLSTANLSWAFTQFHASNWHPLTWISHMVDCALFDLNPGPHHWTNVLFHTANSLLVLLVLRSLTGSVWRSAVVAGLFAWHPLHVESVAWIAERKDVLCAFFFLLALWAYARYAREPGRGGYLLVMMFFVCALLAKAMAVTFPFVLLLVDFWPLRRWEMPTRDNPGSIRQSLRQLAMLVVEKLPLVALSAIHAIITVNAQRSGDALVNLGNLPLVARVQTVAAAYVAYLGKLVWPAPLAVIYPHPLGLPLWEAAGSALLLAIITVLAIARVKTRPYLAFGWLWFVGMLVPVIGLVQVGMQFIADRYSYLPFIGLFVALVWGVADWAGRWRHRNAALGALFTVVLLATLIGTWNRLPVWRDTPSLLNQTLSVTSRNFVADFALGSYYIGHGDLTGAEKHLKRAIEVTPTFARAQGTLGLLYAKQGKPQAAIEQYLLTLKLKPDYAEMWNDLGLAYGELKQAAKEMECYEKAVGLRPDLAEARNNLGRALAAQGRHQEAIAQYTAAVALDPRLADLRVNLGNSLAQTGRFQEAIGSYLEALQIDPRHRDARDNLGLLAIALGQFDRAASLFAEAVKETPDDPLAHLQLARALAGLEKKREAIGHYRDTIRLKPDSADALNSLARLLATDGDAAVRNGTEAVRLAEKACELTGRKDPADLDTLAAAYAEAGEFSKAVTAEQEAADQATAMGQTNRIPQLQEHLRRFQEGQPWRDK